MVKITKNTFIEKNQDCFKDECGVFGIFGSQNAGVKVTLGLHALQHRGQEAAGVVSYDGKHFHSHRALGHVADNFNSESVINAITGNSAIGHNRYSTSGHKTVIRNVQPIFAEIDGGGLAVAHNGNLTNASKLRNKLTKSGCIFQSTLDTEVIVHLIATSNYKNLLDRIVDALGQIEGAYSIIILTNDGIIGARDPHGVRPLVLGKLEEAYILASETCALDILGAKHLRQIERGEVIHINNKGFESHKNLLRSATSKFCVFEYIYFSRPDSFVEGENVYEVRKRIGAELAKECYIKADIVVPVPDSGVPAAIGYSTQANIPFELGIIRNHYVGRTFIQPNDYSRQLGVRLKHNANNAALRDKSVILIDDSIVRGTTSKKIVEMVRDGGAKEVHMRIASPPITNGCYYGVDTPEKNKLLASRMSVKEMGEHIGLDSIDFISINGLYRAVSQGKIETEKIQYCDACFTGNYPIPLTDKDSNEPGLLTLLNETS